MQRRHLIQWGLRPRCTSSLGAQAQSFPVKPIKLVIAFPAGGPPTSPCAFWPTTPAKSPARGGGEQTRRWRHAARAGLARHLGRWLHAGADSAGRVPPALHHQDQLGPGQGHQLRAQRHGLRLCVVVPADSPLKTWTHFVAWAKANPGKLSYGSTGTMTSPHLTMELAAQKLGIELLHVPLPRAAPI